jgi:hypothetical protein
LPQQITNADDSEQRDNGELREKTGYRFAQAAILTTAAMLLRGGLERWVKSFSLIPMRLVWR